MTNQAPQAATQSNILLIDQLVQEYPPKVLGSPKPSQQGDAASPHDDNIPAQDDGGFSVLMVALYLQQVSRSSKSELGRPGIFLYKNQGGESVGREDKEKTAPDSPEVGSPI